MSFVGQPPHSLIAAWVWARCRAMSGQEVLCIIHPTLNEYTASVLGIPRLPRWPLLLAKRQVSNFQNVGLLHQGVRVFTGEDPPSDADIIEFARAASALCDVVVVGIEIEGLPCVEVTHNAIKSNDWFAPLSLSAGIRACVAAGVGIPLRGRYVKHLQKVQALING